MAKKKVKESRKTQKKEVTRKTGSKLYLLFAILVIFVSSLAVYLNSLSNDFVYDDIAQVWDNPWIKDIRHLPEIFSKSVWSFETGSETSNYYRPLMHVFYMLAYRIFGLNPWGFHLINVLFHAGVSVLVFIVTMKLLQKFQSSSSDSHILPSSTAALLFASHPIHTEAVTWIAGLPDLSFTFFYLLSFYLYVLSRDGHKYSYPLSVTSFALAALCKEPALTLLIILIAYDFIVKKHNESLSDRIRRYLPFFLVAGVYLVLRYHALGGFAPEKKYQALNIYQYAINVFPLVTQYLEKLLLPLNLNAFHVFHPISSLFEVRGFLSLLITMAYMVCIFLAFKKNRLVFFGLVLIIVPLLPVLYIPVLGENTFAERYLYLPSFGFVLLIALLLAWVRVNKPAAVRILMGTVIVLAGLYSAATISRNTVWKNDYTLFSDTIRKAPDAKIPRNRLGGFLLNRGRIEEAIEQYQVALQLDPDSDISHYNLGLAFSSKGRIEEAIEQYQAALQLDPDFADAHNGLATAYFNKGEVDKAIEQYQVALRLDPNNEKTHNNLGLAYFRKGQVDKAIEQYEAALRLKPDNGKAHSNLGLAYLNKGRTDKAIEQFKDAVRLNPENPKYRTYLENAYKQKALKQ
jgi:protein O-mannosyl-transferase